MAGAPPAPATRAPLGSPSNPVIIDVWTGMAPLRGHDMPKFWNRTLNQVFANSAIDGAHLTAKARPVHVV
jgi:hypothetical protein